MELSDKPVASCGPRNAGHDVLVAVLQVPVVALWMATAFAREEAAAITESKPPADMRWRDGLRFNGIPEGRLVGSQSVYKSPGT